MRAVFLAIVVAAILIAGCVEPGARQADAKVLAGGKNAAQAEGGQRYIHIEPDVLTQPQFEILPLVSERLPSSIDGISLFVDIVRPDTKDPVPTILHSSPYNQLERVPGEYPLLNYPQFAMAQEYVPRGYAFVVADVRGFSESEGCVEIWGKNEQQDQYDLVEWIAEQPWSNGKVGMIGVSYPGTTPMEAAVMAPPHLTTIIAVAGLTDPYFDWHYGGVPNGESLASPVAYHQLGVTPPVVFSHGVDWAKATSNSGCGFTEIVTAAYQTDGVYTDYYKERNLSARVKNVNVPVLYTQGFIDGNVKPAQLLNWFNALDVPKKGIFGQWAHNNPEREDWDNYVHAWFDEHLMGRDTGIMAGPVVEVTTNKDTWRMDTHFPPLDAVPRSFHFDLAAKTLKDTVPDSASTATFKADRVTPAFGVDPSRFLMLESGKIDDRLYLSGVVTADFHAAIEGDTNVFYYGELMDIAPDGTEERIVFGALNAALRDGLEVYKPVPEGDVIRYRMNFQPREWVVEPGHSLRLTLSTMDASGSTTTEATQPVDVTLHSGPDQGSMIVLPLLATPNDQPLPYQ